MWANMKWWLGGFVILLCQAEQELPTEVSLLAKIKAKAAQNVKQVPNYTCTETIQRSERPMPGGHDETLDTVHLEVAYVQGKELFGWPGAAKIDQSDIKKLVGGTIGNGYFALLLENIFLGQSSTFHYEGHTELDGKGTVVYSFHVPLLGSGYRITTASGSAVVGYHGSFRADASTQDLKRIEVVAEDIPSALRLLSASESIEYSRAPVGNSMFALPLSGDLSLIDSAGVESRNHMTFKNCRQFAADSVLTFSEIQPEGAKIHVNSTAEVTNLPVDFTVNIRLETPIDSATSAVGDTIMASFRNDIKVSHTTVVPKGAKLSGHITRLEKRQHSYSLELAFTSLEFKGGHGDLSERKNEVFMLVESRGLASTPTFDGRAVEQVSETQSPLVFKTGHMKLVRGTELMLRSRQ